MHYVIKLHNDANHLGFEAWHTAKQEITEMLIPRSVKRETYHSQFNDAVVYFFEYGESYEKSLFELAEDLSASYDVRITVASLNIKVDK